MKGVIGKTETLFHGITGKTISRVEVGTLEETPLPYSDTRTAAHLREIKIHFTDGSGIVAYFDTEAGSWVMLSPKRAYEPVAPMDNYMRGIWFAVETMLEKGEAGLQELKEHLEPAIRYMEKEE